MKKLVFLLEELSMKETLDILLPAIIPGCRFVCISHDGKADLQNSIPHKLSAWKEPDVQFVIVHDKDSADCKILKQHLQQLASNAGRPDTLIRIVCAELESWFLGDFNALEKAFDVSLKNYKNQAKYREPDSLGNAKQELKRIIPAYSQISGAKSIAPHMDISQNKSHCFYLFVEGVKKLYND